MNSKGYSQAIGMPIHFPNCAGNHSTTVKPGFNFMRTIYIDMSGKPNNVEIRIATHASLPADVANPNMTEVPS